MSELESIANRDLEAEMDAKRAEIEAAIAKVEELKLELDNLIRLNNFKRR